ncbi:MAG: DeoR/GlpR family DNA-binding transcription regulator [Treponema sp.]|nr:DeoR/GlpR family DNA-binding transcription regulator [Treponema sp.]
MNIILNARQKQVVDLVQSFHFITIKQLAQQLQVSEMTIRRDIQILAEANMLKQVFGGVTALKPNETGTNYSITQAKSHNMNSKVQIAKKAIELLNPNEVLFFDIDTTTQALAEQLPPNASNTIITSSFNILEILARLPDCTIISAGGVYSPKQKVFYNHDSADFFKRYRANKAFIGTTGFDLNLEFTCSYLEDVPLKQAMIESSKERILLTDSSKFGKVSTYFFGRLSDFTMIITDNAISDEYADHIRSSGVELILVQ